MSEKRLLRHEREDLDRRWRTGRTSDNVTTGYDGRDFETWFDSDPSPDTAADRSET